MNVKSGDHEYTKKFACKKFTCQVCGPHVRKRFMAQVLQGMDGEKECSLLTLTTRKYSRVSDLNKNWNKWIKRLKRRLDYYECPRGTECKCPEANCKLCLQTFEFVKIVEFQKNGNPHLHAILNRPPRWFKTKRVKEWNVRKRKFDWWIDKDDWLLKHWQEVNNDNRITRIALNPVLDSKEGTITAAGEVAKYLSKAKSKNTEKQRWYSFSAGFRGCRPKITIWAATYSHLTHFQHEEGCNESIASDCNCQRSVIAWDFKHFSDVFINYDLIKMMIGGQPWHLQPD